MTALLCGREPWFPRTGGDRPGEWSEASPRVGGSPAHAGIDRSYDVYGGDVVRFPAHAGIDPSQ